MGIQNPIRQGLAVAVILLFVGVAFAPSIKSDVTISTISLNEGSLSGYVNDTLMNPVQGARVRVYFHETYEEDYTDSSGYYHVTNIPICYCLKNATASKAGYTTEWVLLSIDENTTYDFVLTPLDGNTLYVGGDGPGNYSSIQDAIDDASDGDTVFVFDDSSPYKEGININKSLNIIGENRETTVIDGEDVFIEDGIIVDIRSDFNAVYLHYSSNNTIENNLIIEGEDVVFDFTGIYLYESDNNLVSDNTVIGKKWNKFDSGINVGFSKDNVFLNNTFFNLTFLAWERDFANNFFEGNTNNGKPILCLNGESNMVIDDAAQIALIDCNNILLTNLEMSQLHLGIILSNSHYCEISNCTFTQNYVGIRLASSSHNSITENTIKNGFPKLLDMTIGIWLEASSYNTITKNDISTNGLGLNLEESDGNTISGNQIIRNRAILKLPFFGWSGGLNLHESNDNIISSNTFIGNLPHAFFRFCQNTWEHNYWGRPRIALKIIFGLTYGGWMEPPKLTFEFDLRPALKPFNI